MNPSTAAVKALEKMGLINAKWMIGYVAVDMITSTK